MSEFRFETLRRELRFLSDGEAYERCRRYITSFRGRTTSATVVAELYARIRRTTEHGRRRLWSLVYDEFRGMMMSEEAVRLVECELELIARYGPTDVNLLEIGRRQSSRRPVILTLDRPFAAECRRAGVRAKLLQELVLDRG